MHMTDISGFQGRTIPVSSAATFPAAPLLSETYWGFIVRSSERPPLWVQASQAVAMVVGASLAAAILGIWGLPTMSIPFDSFFFRTGLTAVFGAMSFLLISYANQGVTSELQFDFGLGEVREVISSRSGKSQLFAHYGFDAFVGLTIDRTGGDPSHVGLVLQHQGRAHDILVATGTDAEIGVIYGRLERDLLRKGGTRVREVVPPNPLR